MFNPYILVPLAAWAIAQLTKFIVSATEGELDFKALYASGGMPSVHAAVVCSLATTALLYDGVGSHLFGFTAIFAAIVMYDSLGVRRSSGEQGQALNMVIASLTKNRISLSDPSLKLREVLGHKPIEVGVGALYGIFLGLLLNIDRISPVIAFLGATPVRIESYVYFGIGAFLVLFAIVSRLILSRRKSAAIGELSRRIFYVALVGGVVIAVLAFGDYERAAYISWRLWDIVALAGLVGYKYSIWKWARRTLPSRLSDEQNAERLAKWMPTSKKKRSKKRA